ncbi:general negative regulator of transcription subunit 5, partial [Rhizophlyctis rosea]
EIDKVLKKVSEGVEIFQGTFEKLQTATNAAQKEKYEGDLKKEIKKLQRYRDQIRTWLSSNDIKDKRALEDNRRLIEQQMERFKACEKELKTKAFSKEGLQAATKVDPEERERGVFNEYMSETKGKLEQQIDALEAEQEQLTMAVRKSKRGDSAKAERLAQIEHHLERHKWHIQKLEIIQRMVDNGKVKIDEVRHLQEDVNYYVDSNQEPDFEEDEGIYDDLNLEDAEIYGLPVEKEDDSDDEGGRGNPLQFRRIISILTGSRNISAGHSVDERRSAPEPSTPVRDEVKRKPTITKEAEEVVSPTKPVKPPSLPRPQAADKHEAKPTPAAPKATPAKATTPAPAAAAAVRAVPAVVPTPKPVETPAPVPSITQRYSVAAAASTPHPEPSRPAAEIKAVPAKAPTPRPSTDVPPPSATAQPRPSPAPVPSPAPTPAVRAATQRAATLPTPTADQPPSAEPTESIDNRLPPTLADLVSSFEATKERSLKAREDATFFQQMLETSFQHVPDALDSERPKNHHPKRPAPGTPTHPPTPFPLFDTPLLFEKFDVDTLFFIFYYQQGTYQQYLAARELKRQSWRFHKKYLTWFQRHEEPKSITDEYEQGTYIYFDYEGAWCQRKKGDF